MICRQLPGSGSERTRSLQSICVIGLALAAALAVTPPAAAEDAACEGYRSPRLITALGGSNAFSRQPVSNLEELQQRFVDLAPDIRYVLDTQDLAHLAKPLFDAVASGEGVTEVSLDTGDTLEWMAWRKRGEPQVTDNMCYIGSKPYEAWQIDVWTKEKSDDCSMVSKTHYKFLVPGVCVNLGLVGTDTAEKKLDPIPPPTCALTAERTCDASRSISVDASGSSPGVVVKLGDKVVISGDSTSQTWSGSDGDPYSTATFTAWAGNEDLCGQAQECSGSAAVEPCEKASCVIASLPETVKAGEPIPIDVSGHWDGDNVKVVIKDSKGEVVREVPPPFPTSVTLRKAGDYQISAVATNALGDSATCEVPVTVKRRCTVRGLLGAVSAGSREHQLGYDDLVVTDRTDFNLDDGDVVGAEVECFVAPKLGLFAGLLLGDLEGRFMRDIDDAWETTESDFDMLIASAGANWHLTPNAAFDFYVGAFASLVQLGDATFSALGDTQRIDLDDHFGIGGQLGLGVPFGSGPWSFHAGVRYQDLSANSTALGGFDLDVSPTIYTVGLGYDF